MKKLVIMASILCSACAPALTSNGANSAANTPFVIPPAPTAGFIVYTRMEGNRFKLYRQDINGTALGDDHLLQDDDRYFGDGDIRYPRVTPDGAFIYYTERDSIAVGQAYDQFVVADNRGRRIWSSGPIAISNCGPYDLNYPELISYSYDGTANSVSFQMSGQCASPNGWLEVSVTAQDISNDPAFYDTGVYEQPNPGWLNTPGNGVISFGLEGEQAIIPEPVGSLNSWVPTYGARDPLSFRYVNQSGANTGPTHPCDQYGPVYVDEASKADAGNPPNGLSPFQAYETKQAFAPSISSDGKYLMFNSEVYENGPLGEELMYIGLPSDPCAGYRIVTPPPPTSPNEAHKLPYVPTKSTITRLNSGPGDDYGSFAVNQGYGYVMQRSNDPSAGGRTVLYFSPDLTTPPQRLHPGSTAWEAEGSWFFQ